MHDLRIPLAAILFAFTGSASAAAADIEGLPNGDGGARQVAGQCVEELQEFDQTLADVGFGIMPPGSYGMSAPLGYYGYSVGSTPRHKLYALRDAAYVYAIDGDEKSCQLVLASMRKTYEGHQKLVDAETDNPSLMLAWRRAHLANAQPVSEMTRLMRAGIVIGAEIRNPQDERLGEIKDLALDPARPNIAFVLASRGGFLGLGESLVAVRWKDLRVTEDHELYVLDMTKAAFGKAPTIGRANFEKAADPGWRRGLDRFWDKNIGQ